MDQKLSCLTTPIEKAHAMSPTGIEARLTSVSNMLDSLSRSSEQQFLDIGRCLNDYLGISRVVEAQSLEVIERLSGQDAVAAIGDLNGLCDRIRGTWQEGELKTGRRLGRLKEILVLLGDLHRGLDDLQGIVKRLRTLSISTRIETARMGNEGFGALAEKVQVLATQVESSRADIRREALALADTVQKAVPELTAFLDHQLKAGRAMLEAVESSLVSLHDVFRSSEEAARTVSDRMSSITSHISTIIASLQFHDIARQRLEHVQSALRSVAENRGGREEPADVCALQAAHLRRTREEMVGAIGKVIEELALLNTDVDLLTAEMKSSAGFQTSDNVSVLGQVDHSLRPVFELLKGAADRTEGYFGVKAKVKEEITAIHRFVEDIDEVVTEIELFALNSRIKAACMGVSGAPLGVISEMIGSLSDTARSCAARILELLTKIGQPSVNLPARQKSSSPQSAPRPEDWQGHIVPILSFLTRVSTEVAGALREMDQKTTSLSESISTMIESTSVHTMFTETITKAVGELEDIALTIADRPSRPANSAIHEDELASRYTMESERMIHRHFAASSHGRGDPTKDGSSGATVGGSENEYHFTTNVELF